MTTNNTTMGCTRVFSNLENQCHGYTIPQPANYPLPDDLYDTKDWRAGTYSERVEWLRDMYEAKKAELEVFHSVHENCKAAPQPVIAPTVEQLVPAPKQPTALQIAEWCGVDEHSFTAAQESVATFAYAAGYAAPQPVIAPELIAAAPDLLAALQGVVRVADRTTSEFDAARAAIAKATKAKA
jgi:hypothetical protein